MKIDELKVFLNILTVKQLKLICNGKRLWGVYNTHPAITGYSKCKNKKELVEHIFKYFCYYTKKHFGDNECPNYYGYLQKEINFSYNGNTIDMKTIKINFLEE